MKTNRLAMLIAALVPALSATGCARMQPGLGFDEVRQAVSERTGMRVQWINGTADDLEAEAAVNALLECELTAREAVQIALLENRDLQAVYEDLRIAQSDLVQAGLLRNPVLSGEVRFGIDSAGTGADLGVAQDFVSLLGMPLRKGRAGAAFEAAKIRITASVLDVAGEARQAFYEYQAAEQTREMRQAVLEATHASYELARRLRQAGNNRDLDVTSERDLHEQAKVDLALSEEETIQAREEVNAVLGLWGKNAGWRAAPRLPAVPEEELSVEGIEHRAIEASLDLALARREIEVAARSLGMAGPLAWLHDIEAGAVAEREVEGDWSAGPSLSLPLPLFDQGQAASGKAAAELRQAGRRYFARAVEVRSRARAAAGVLLSARDRARYYDMVILPLRQQLVNQTQLQFNAMQVSAFQLLEAKRNQIQGGAEYIRALRDYWVARARLEQVLSGRAVRAGGGGGGGGKETAGRMRREAAGEH